MIITFAQYKGGCSKTTMAIHTAAMCQEVAPTLLVDSDANRSATLWSSYGNLPFPVVSDAEAPKLLMSGAYTYVVMDTPARPDPDSVIAIANGSDLLIVPTTPESLSVSALVQFVRSLPPDTNYRCLVTIAPTGGSQNDGQEVRDQLIDYGFPCFNTVIRRYKAYIHAASKGILVTSGAANNDLQDYKKELIQLWPK